MEETRKIGDYSVKYSMYIGYKDIALGENPNADKDERYMCCFVETNAISIPADKIPDDEESSDLLSENILSPQVQNKVPVLCVL